MATKKKMEDVTVAPYSDDAPFDDDLPTDVAVPDDEDASALSVSGGGGTQGMFSMNFTPEDVQIPRIRLAQALTPEVVNGDAKAGNWIVPGQGAVEKLTITVMGVRHSRARVVGDDNERQVVCTAGAPIGTPLHGVGDPGIQCQACPFSQWKSDDKGRRIPPECNYAYEYLCATDDGSYATIVMQKTAERTGKELNAVLAQRGGQPTEVTLGSNLQRSGNRSWYVPTVDNS